MNASDHSEVSARLDDLIARAHQTEQVPFLQRPVQEPSDNPPGDLAQHGEMTAGLLEGLGFTVQRHRVPNDLVSRAGMRSAINLVVRHVFDRHGPTIALNAHGDVVPPGDGWSLPPYGAQIVEGALYGRGAAVSKSDFATYAFALRALIQSGLKLRGTVELHFTYDEEIGGTIGPGWLLEQGHTNPDYVISAGATFGIVTAHNGCLQLETTLRGMSAHAAWPDTGVDAIQAAVHILGRLYRWREGLQERISTIAGIPSPTLIVGTMSGGTAANVVPDQVSFRIDRRILPDESPEEVEAETRKMIEGFAAECPGVACQIKRLLLARPLRSSPAQAPLIDALQVAARRVLGETILPVGTPLFTDARLYAAADCATVLYGAGPKNSLDANGHRADEHIVLEDLSSATRVVACALHSLLATE